MDCSWPLHCPISRKEGRTTLHVAVDKEGAMMDSVPSFWGAPFLPNTGPPALGSGSRDPPRGPFSCPGSACVHGPPRFRLMLEDSTFQALREEPLFKRLHTKCAALPGGEGILLSLPFPRKWWTIINSHRFMSFWWEEDGSCVGINEELFENMEWGGSNKLFETDCMKSFVCQLSLYGFSKVRQDVLTSLCLTTLLMEELPVCVLSKGIQEPGGEGRGLRTVSRGQRTEEVQAVPGVKSQALHSGLT
ncbi:heat shock transcription factor, Y-linked-like isoform 2-T2 [Dama dama]|uniref:heat shock transcription factor, Y-linked-like isoform X2 n=1 Tax=Dama dama TaxID=30532 RepID=UPI002A35B905|nr:heat shock transcription factor, Y-linked-like isoform X2 [Dama dama]